jgi:hypothetical protein
MARWYAHLELQEAAMPRTVRNAHRSSPVPDPVEPGAGPTPTRRQLIAGGAVGVTALASGVLLPAVARAATRSAPASAASGAPATGEVVVAHVRDVDAGHIDVYIGQRQVRITDRGMAARLARAAH